MVSLVRYTRLILVNYSRRKVNIVSHFLPDSVWSIVSREIILLPAELIPLPEEANRSRPNSAAADAQKTTCTPTGGITSWSHFNRVNL